MNELFLEIILLLFQQERLGLGRAAELLNLSQFRFRRLILERGICIHYDVAKLQENIQYLTAERWL